MRCFFIAIDGIALSDSIDKNLETPLNPLLKREADCATQIDLLKIKTRK